MHELPHSFGWAAGFSYPGDADENNWWVFSQFVTTFDGNSPIDPDTYLWNSAYDPYLVGYGGGMFFTGQQARSRTSMTRSSPDPTTQ
jgi:hypothetical protein